jgi:multiple sugar transport system substrate-binding protein
MHLIKKLALTTLISTAIITAAFANGSAESKTKDNSTTTLNVAIWDLAQTPADQEFADEYEALHPDVKVNLIDLGSADYQQMLLTQLSGGGSDIDVCFVKDIPGYVNLVNKDLLLPLKDESKKVGIDTSLYSGLIDQIEMNDNFYAIPFRSNIWVIYYNKDLFDAAGVAYPTNDMTFDEYDAIARKMTRGQGAKKTFGTNYHYWRSTVQLFGILDGEHTILDGNYEFLAPYYKLVLDEQDDGICRDYASLKTSSTHYSGVFYNNECAMMNMGSWFVNTLINNINEGETDIKNFGLAMYPHSEGVDAGSTLATITSIGVVKTTKNKDAAIDFVKFVSGEQGAEILAKNGAFPAISTANIDQITNIKGFPTDQASKDALVASHAYLEMPINPKSADIELILNQVHDEIMTENISIEDGIAKMNKEVTKILNED